MEKALLDIRSLSIEQLTDQLVSMHEAPFRAKQLREWLWKKGAIRFEDMTNLSKGLRDKLKKRYTIKPIKEVERQRSADGTIKFRFVLVDGLAIESVLIPVLKDQRYTVCVSSQVGCSLSCAFCATGQMKRMRNLDAAEIYDQVRLVNDVCLVIYGHPLTNIVYMGMGEPLLNYSQVIRSLQLISAPWGYQMSPKRITISTAGIAKMMVRLARDAPRVNLALSLHAPDDVKRSQIMAINDQNNIEILMEAIQTFTQISKAKISFEYIALSTFNESPEDAQALINLCKKIPHLRVNIIEYNPVKGLPFSRSATERVELFAAMLHQAGVVVTIRRSRGKDIDAACGQLANQ